MAKKSIIWMPAVKSTRAEMFHTLIDVETPANLSWRESSFDYKSGTIMCVLLGMQTAQCKQYILSLLSLTFNSSF